MDKSTSMCLIEPNSQLTACFLLYVFVSLAVNPKAAYQTTHLCFFNQIARLGLRVKMRDRYASPLPGL